MPDAVIFLKRLLLVLGINAGLYLLIAYYPVWRYDFSNGTTESNLLVIPEDVYHGFMVVSKDPGFLLNFPTKLYNQADEGRVDNTQLNWEKVKSDFAKSE